MHYLLLFCGKPHEMEAWEALPDETRAQHARRMKHWFAEHRGQISSSYQFATTWPLRPPAPSVVEIRPLAELA